MKIDGIQDCTHAEALRLSIALADHFPEVSAFLKYLATESKCNYYTMLALNAARGKAFPSVLSPQFS